MPQTSNELFLDAVLRHQVGLSRVSNDIQKKAFRLLNNTEKDLRSEIRQRLLNKPRGLPNPAAVRRMNRLAKSLRVIRLSAWKQAETELTQLLKEVPVAEVEFMSRALQTSVPVVLDPALPSAQLLENLVTSRPFRGSILRDWAKQTRLADVNRIEQQVRIGMVAGEDSKAIARRVVGTVGRRGTDGVTEITRRQATALTRTAVNAFSNDAKQAFYAANSDVFSEEQYVATLDSVPHQFVVLLMVTVTPLDKALYPHNTCNADPSGWALSMTKCWAFDRPSPRHTACYCGSMLLRIVWGLFPEGWTSRVDTGASLTHSAVDVSGSLRAGFLQRRRIRNGLQGNRQSFKTIYWALHAEGCSGRAG